jgi:hypothetical protein
MPCEQAKTGEDGVLTEYLPWKVVFKKGEF